MRKVKPLRKNTTANFIAYYDAKPISTLSARTRFNSDIGGFYSDIGGFYNTAMGFHYFADGTGFAYRIGKYLGKINEYGFLIVDPNRHPGNNVVSHKYARIKIRP